MEHLKYILGEEKIDFEEAALWQLGRAAQGSVRDCLTLLDQAIGFCNGPLTAEKVSECLGNIDRAVIQRLMEAHYDPAYARSIGRNFPQYAKAPRLTLSSLDMTALTEVARMLRELEPLPHR